MKSSRNRKGRNRVAGSGAEAAKSGNRSPWKFENGRQERVIQRNSPPELGGAIGLDLHRRHLPGLIFPIQSGQSPAVTTDEPTSPIPDHPQDVARLQSGSQTAGDGGRGLHLSYPRPPRFEPSPPGPAD